MATDLSGISFDGIWRNINGSISNLRRETEYFDSVNNEALLEPLKQVLLKLGKEPIPSPPLNPEILVEEWHEYVDGKRESLNRRTLYYLCWCWESGIALELRFIRYVQKRGTLRWKALYALVRSCHMRWGDEFVMRELKGLLLAYSGPNQILNLWKNNSEMIISMQGPKIFATKMTATSTLPNLLFKEWGIDAQSEFAIASIRAACESCRQKIGMSDNLNAYLIKALLPWDNWELSAFKKEAESIILLNSVESIRENFQAFALKDSRLGDPRLPRNTNWAGIAEAAKSKFKSWLSRRDIIFFFDHVLPKDKDQHGRKQFWLKYVPSLGLSRPLLCEVDRLSLKGLIQTEKIDYGILNGNNSAFILDFGAVVVVEFSRVGGACYIYTREHFQSMINDLFERKYFDFAALKRKDLATERIVHRPDWQDNVTKVLARKGIRRG